MLARMRDPPPAWVGRDSVCWLAPTSPSSASASGGFNNAWLTPETLGLDLSV